MKNKWKKKRALKEEWEEEKDDEEKEEEEEEKEGFRGDLINGVTRSHHRFPKGNDRLFSQWRAFCLELSAVPVVRTTVGVGGS